MMKARAAAAIQEAASEFINRESNRRSMITVTRVAMDARGRTMEIYISAYPDKDLQAAIDFLNRKKGEFSDYLKTHIKIRALPHITFLPEPLIGQTPIE